MREIKFRQAIFHPVIKAFLKWHYWGLIDDAFVGVDTGWVSPKEAVKNSYQYTGLKDKNGKEIYEGDIVRFWNGAVGVVEFHTELLGFYAHIQGDDWRVLNAENWEVIGNIYENRELLKEAGSETK